MSAGRPSTGVTPGQDDRYQDLKERILDGRQNSLSFKAIKRAVGGDDDTIRRYRQALVDEGIAEFNKTTNQCCIVNRNNNDEEVYESVEF